MRHYMLTLATLVAVMLGNQAFSAPEFYDNAADFNTATTGFSLTTETLDDEQPGSLPLVTNTGITITSGQSAELESGTNKSILFFNQTGEASVTFAFDSPINAFGLTLLDAGTNGPTDITLTTALGSQIVFDDFTGASNNTQFAGVVSTATFLSATIRNSKPGDGVSLDDIIFGTAPSGVVPEPTTFLLGGLVCGFGLVVRRLG